MKAPARCRLPSHHIGDHPKDERNDGKRDDHATLHATLGQAVDAGKMREYLFGVNESTRLTNRDARYMFAIRMITN
jgi:hypothetical protein